MYIVACARCQRRLTDEAFTSYSEATHAAHQLGHRPADGGSDGDELLCASCATDSYQAYGSQGVRPLDRRTA